MRSRHPRDDGQRRDRGEHADELEQHPAADLRAGDDEHDAREHGSARRTRPARSRGAGARATAPTTPGRAARSTTRRARRPGAETRPRQAPKCRARPSRARGATPAGRRGSLHRGPAAGSNARPARASSGTSAAPPTRSSSSSCSPARRTVAAASPAATSRAPAASLDAHDPGVAPECPHLLQRSLQRHPRSRRRRHTRPLVLGPQRFPPQLPESYARSSSSPVPGFDERDGRDLDRSARSKPRARRSISAPWRGSSSSGVSASTSALRGQRADAG